MKNIQIIDGADNCTYDIFRTTEREFKQIFPEGTDIAFISDVERRLGKTAKSVFERVYKRYVEKKHVHGIHGTLFYELDFKKVFYPTRKESEMLTGPDLVKALREARTLSGRSS